MAAREPSAPLDAAIVTLPSDSYAYVSKNDVTLILSSGQVIVDDSFSFNTSSCLLYAETIVFSASKANAYTISLPGKHIGLFCHTISFASPNLTIDVGGADGDAGVENAPAKPPTPGLNAGSIALSVEVLDSSQVGRDNVGGATGLYLNADGGRGGRGSSMTNPPGQKGGDGAAGGDGGTIAVYFGTQALSIAVALNDVMVDVKAMWASKVATMKKAQANLDASAAAGDISSTSTAAFAQTVADYLSLITNLQSLAKRLQSVLQPGIISSSVLRASIQNLQAVLGVLSLSSDAPSSAIDLSAAIGEVASAISQLLSPSPLPTLDAFTAPSEAALQTAIDNNSGKFVGSPTSQLTTVLARSYRDCVASVGQLRDSFLSVNTSTAAGLGGRPGNGDINAGRGKEGQSGNPGAVTADLLTFQGNPADLDFRHVLAQPDQAQMLLNTADLLYFSGGANNDDTVTAAQYYQRLTLRLAFVPALAAAATAKLPQETMLGDAYNAMEYDDEGKPNLTVNALTQLENVQSRALANLSQILLGQDMFGHAAPWTPRLSYTHYDQRASKLLTNLSTIEVAYNTYYQALQSNTASSNDLSAGVANAKARMADAKGQINLITDPNGPMEMSAAQIAAFTPMLKAKRAEVSTYINKIADRIDQAQFSFDPQTWISCLSTIAMAPTKFNAAASVFSAGYSSLHQVKALDGTDVSRDYVVSQLEQCDGTLNSLQEAYANCKDGTVEVDDPGAAKILMLQSQLDDLLTKFSGAIPSDLKDETEKLMKDYVSIIQQRNSAAIALNATLQILYQARQDLAYYTQQDSNFNQEILQVDPTLPSVCFWMKKSATDMGLLVLQAFNYGARALQFWGPMLPISFDTASGMPEAVQLVSYQTNLLNGFDTCLERYGSLIQATWPTPGELGVCYKLTDSELMTLQEPVAMPNGNTSYSVVLRNITAPTKSTPPARNVFHSKANVRITQVHFWLPKVIVGPDVTNRRMLIAEITQYGDETIVAANNQKFSFVHDQISLQWQYDTTNITEVGQFASATGELDEEILSGCYTGGGGRGNPPGGDVYAPIGPFATWQITINSLDNIDLDLSQVDEAYLEFAGSHIPFL